MKTDRLLNAIILSIYAFVFFYIYVNYLSLEWGYTGLRYREIQFYQIVFTFGIIALQGYAQPPLLYRPSSVIVNMLLILLYVPAMIITTMAGERGADQYYDILISFSIAMLAMSIMTSRRDDQDRAFLLPKKSIYFLFTSVFVIFTFLLVYIYEDIMSFSEIDDVYFQRFVAADFAVGGVVGYIRTHYLYVFSSFLFGASLLKRGYWPMGCIGILGFIVVYLIDASKISFIIPLIMIAFFFVYRYGEGRTLLFNAGISIIAFACGILVQFSGLPKLFGDLVLLRSMAIPAQTLAQYADVFDARGYTWWSHVRGISSIVPPPDSFLSDPFWPALGQIVGADLYGNNSRLNLNANPFSGEGVAAAGPIGIIVIGMVLIVFLKLLDFVARGWNRDFLLLVSVPIGISLVNAHLSTTLLSFGGGFWLAFLYFGQKIFAAPQRPLRGLSVPSTVPPAPR